MTAPSRDHTRAHASLNTLPLLIARTAACWVKKGDRECTSSCSLHVKPPARVNGGCTLASQIPALARHHMACLGSPSLLVIPAPLTDRQHTKRTSGAGEILIRLGADESSISTGAPRHTHAAHTDAGRATPGPYVTDLAERTPYCRNHNATPRFNVTALHRLYIASLLLIRSGDVGPNP